MFIGYHVENGFLLKMGEYYDAMRYLCYLLHLYQWQTHPEASSPLQGTWGKETPYLPLFSCFVQKIYQLSSIKPQGTKKSEV